MCVWISVMNKCDACFNWPTHRYPTSVGQPYQYQYVPVASLYLHPYEQKSYEYAVHLSDQFKYVYVFTIELETILIGSGLRFIFMTYIGKNSFMDL